MEQIETYQLAFIIKQLKLSVKFPCKLTFQHAGRALTSEIQSNLTNLFYVNKEVVIQQKEKDYLEININLATEKGSNIMAGIIKINLKDICSSEGEDVTFTLQKCLDPYANCTILIKAVKISKSRIKKTNLFEDKRNPSNESKFQTKSEAPIMDNYKQIKPRLRYKDAQTTLINKKSNLNYMLGAGVKDKAFSIVGLKDISFQKDQLNLRFKHLNQKVDQQDNKTVVPGKWRQTQQIIKASLQSNQKELKLQIIKYKIKYQESQRNQQEKNKQIKALKDQILQLNSQLAEKSYLIEQINIKDTQIRKLDDQTKRLSKDLHQEKDRIIQLERELEDRKDSYENQMFKLRGDLQKKQYDFQKSSYQKKQQIKQILEEIQYKVNQINKMKILIEQLEKNLDIKTIQFEKSINSEKNQHQKTKNNIAAKDKKWNQQLQMLEFQLNQLTKANTTFENQLPKFIQKLTHTQQILKQKEANLLVEMQLKEKAVEQKKILLKNEEYLKAKVNHFQKQYVQKNKQLTEITNQLNQTNNNSKKKINELVQKHKNSTTKIQQYENKINMLSAFEQKSKRSIEILQKQVKNLQQNDRLISKNGQVKDERILQLERQLLEFENKNNLMESLNKKDIQYKSGQIEKLTVHLQEIERLYEKQRSQIEEKRIQLLKNESKLAILLQSTTQLNEQIKQLKQHFQWKQQDLHNQIAELQAEMKQLWTKESKYNKQLYSNQMQKINLKNQIGRYEKMLESSNQKVDRLKKRQIELETEIKKISLQISLSTEESAELRSEYKILQDNFRLLQADKSKNQKITLIISKEKDNVKSNVNNLKRQLQKRDQKEEQYVAQIRTLGQQITKTELKLSKTTKQFQKFKTSITDSLKATILIKPNYLANVSLNQHNLEFSRVLPKSRVNKNQISQMPFILQSGGQLNYKQLIESFVSQSQQVIIILEQQLRKVRQQKQTSQKQYNLLSNKLKQTEDQQIKIIKQMNDEIKSLMKRNSEEQQVYQKKISGLEKQITRKDRQAKQISKSLQQIAFIKQNQKSSHEINVSDLFSKIQSLKYKIVELERKDQHNAKTFINLQQKIIQNEQDNIKLSYQIQIYQEQSIKKEKTINLKLDQIEQLKQNIEIIKKSKIDVSNLFSVCQQNLAVEKENIQRLAIELREEYTKNVQLKLSNNELLKLKQNLLKKDFQKSQMITNLEETIQVLKRQNNESIQDIKNNAKIINQLRNTIKSTQTTSSNFQILLNEANINIEKEKEKIKEKQRRIAQKLSQIQILSNQVKMINGKFKTELKISIDENLLLNSELNRLKQQASIKTQDYEIQIKSFRDSQKKINQFNISLEEQIFFEKQMNTLNSSKIEDLKKEVSDLQSQLRRSRNQVNSLTQLLKERQESLFALSGKLYTYDNNIQGKQQQFKTRIKRIQEDWHNKVEQICQEYKHKLKTIERQKNYLKTGMEQFKGTVEKLEKQKCVMRAEQQKEKDMWELRIKKVEEEKIACLIEKNRQIEKIKEVIQQLEERMRRKEYQYKLLEEEKKKAEEKIKDSKNSSIKNQQRNTEVFRKLQKENDQLKRKEGQLKRFKQALKNNQWTIERQIKKGVQNATKTIINIVFEEKKFEVMEVMKSLQSTIAKLAFPNIDQL